MQQIFIGTYTEGTKSQGIYTVLFDEETGSLSRQFSCGACKNPSFVIQNGTYLFAAEELDSRGQVASFRIDPEGRLLRIGEQSVPGSLTCHVQLNRQGTRLYAANYGSGCYFGCSVSDGTIGCAHTHIQNRGHGSHPQRQEGPHAHSVNFASEETELLTADLGIDCILRDRILEDGTLVPHRVQPRITLPSGQGPRHMAFHPGGRWFYVATELGNHVFQFTWDGAMWNQTGAWPTLPPEFTEPNLAADLHISPDGKRLFVSNRGKDDIAVYRIASENGALTELFRIETRGRTPRNFALLADGRYLIIANQDSDLLVAYAMEQNASRARLVSELSIPSPVCICPRR